MSSFYIELSSNASYETNTVANFKNKIQMFTPLKGSWEFALVEISYTKSWKNVRNSCNVGLTIRDGPVENRITTEKTDGYFPDSPQKRKGVIRDGYYEDAMALCREIFNELTSHPEVHLLPVFHFDNIRKIIFIEPGLTKKNKICLPYMNEEIAALLGFDNFTTKEPNFNAYKYVYADRPADINCNLKTLYVYCDICEPQYVGDSRTKLLKTVEVPDNSKYGDQIFLNYTNPHYVPLLVNEFEQIEVDIKDDTDCRIPFMFGRTRLKLHFRRRDD